jgi:hypothetical protein
VTAFWYVIVALSVLAAIINFSIAAARRQRPAIAAVRVVAGLVSLAAVVGIILGKLAHIAHPYLQAQYVFIAFGIFIFAVLVLPSYVDRGTSEAPQVTMQERAARPVKATVRLKGSGNGSTEDWIN